jgi:uncharacterized protein YhaN
MILTENQTSYLISTAFSPLDSVMAVLATLRRHSSSLFAVWLRKNRKHIFNQLADLLKIS